MKKTAFFLILLSILSISAQENSSLTIKFSNITPTQGKIMIALCNSEETFEKRTTPYRKRIIDVTGNTSSTTFRNLPAGDYAVKVIHDENSNMKMDTNLVGLPKEGFGFSNNKMGRMSPPSFDSAKVAVSGDLTINIIMKYL